MCEEGDRVYTFRFVRRGEGVTFSYQSSDGVCVSFVEYIYRHFDCDYFVRYKIFALENLTECSLEVGKWFKLGLRIELGLPEPIWVVLNRVWMKPT